MVPNVVRPRVDVYSRRYLSQPWLALRAFCLRIWVLI